MSVECTNPNLKSAQTAQNWNMICTFHRHEVDSPIHASLYPCVYLCMYRRMYWRMNVCMYHCMYRHMYIWVYFCLMKIKCSCTHSGTCSYTCNSTCGGTHTSTRSGTCMRVYTRWYMQARVSLCVKYCKWINLLLSKIKQFFVIERYKCLIGEKELKKILSSSSSKQQAFSVVLSWPTFCHVWNL